MSAASLRAHALAITTMLAVAACATPAARHYHHGPSYYPEPAPGQTAWGPSRTNERRNDGVPTNLDP